MNYNDTIRAMRQGTLRDGRERLVFCNGHGCSDIYLGTDDMVVWPGSEVSRVLRGEYNGTLHTHPTDVTLSLVDLARLVENPLQWAEVVMAPSGRVCRATKTRRMLGRESPESYYVNGMDESKTMREKIIKTYADRNAIKYNCRQDAAPAAEEEYTIMSKEAKKYIGKLSFDSKLVQESIRSTPGDNGLDGGDYDTGLVMTDEQKELYAARLARFDEEHMHPFIDPVLGEINYAFWKSIRATIKAALHFAPHDVGVRKGGKIVVAGVEMKAGEMAA